MLGSPPRCGGRRGARLLALGCALLALVLPRLARADTANDLPAAVLGLDSDDAEDQADALTSALRSRVRASEGWSLVETSLSLGMLTAALRCPSRSIDTECQQKIAEHIKTERFFFGWVSKGPLRGQVTAELHLVQRGKPDSVVRETYADNLNDQNDDALRAVAERILDRLGGSAIGALVVRMGTEDGEVIVDGSRRVPLRGGTARLALAPGKHSVEVAVAGQPSQRRDVIVTGGKETLVELEQSDAMASSAPATTEGRFPTREVASGALAALGAVAVAVSVVNVIAYADDADRARANEADPNPAVLKLPPGKRASDVCEDDGWVDAEICKIDADARRHSTIAIVTGVGGGLLLAGGLFLLLTGGDSDAEAATTGAAKKPTAKLTPTFGPRSGGLVLSGTF